MPINPTSAMRYIAFSLQHTVLEIEPLAARLGQPQVRFICEKRQNNSNQSIQTWKLHAPYEFREPMNGSTVRTADSLASILGFPAFCCECSAVEDDG